MTTYIMQIDAVPQVPQWLIIAGGIGIIAAVIALAWNRSRAWEPACGPGCICGGSNLHANQNVHVNVPVNIRVPQAQPQIVMLPTQQQAAQPQVIYLQSPPTQQYLPQAQQQYLPAPQHSGQAQGYPTHYIESPRPTHYLAAPQEYQQSEYPAAEQYAYYTQDGQEIVNYEPEVQYLPPAPQRRLLQPPQSTPAARRAHEQQGRRR